MLHVYSPPFTMDSKVVKGALSYRGNPQKRKSSSKYVTSYSAGIESCEVAVRRSFCHGCPQCQSKDRKSRTSRQLLEYEPEMSSFLHTKLHPISQSQGSIVIQFRPERYGRFCRHTSTHESKGTPTGGERKEQMGIQCPISTLGRSARNHKD